MMITNAIVQQQSQGDLYICTAYKLNMRVGPSTDFASVGYMSKDCLFRANYEVNGWISDNGYTWVSKKYMKKYTDDETWRATTMVDLNARKGPGVSYSKVTMIPKGKKLTVLREQNNWFQVKYLGMEVWVSGKYLK